MKRNKLVTITLTAIAALAISTVAHAQSFDTWDGGATDDNFGSGNNWVDNTAPGTGNWILTFQGTVRPTPFNNYTNWDDFREWRFNTSTNFTINGNPIDIGSGGTGKFEVLTGSGGTHTINIGGIGMLQNTEANPVGGNLVFGAGATIFTNGHNLAVWGNNGHTVTFNNSIQGSGSFTLQQNSTAIFNGANTYTGATTINAGTLQLGANDRISDSSNVTVNGGTLNMSTFNDTVASVTLQSGNINGTGTLTSNAAFDMQNGTANAGLGGAVALNKTTNNTVTLGGTTANTYTGATNVLNGTLALNKSGAGANNALGTNANVFIADTAGTNPATLRLDASNQIADTQNVFIRAGGVLNMQTFNDTFNTLNFSNGNTTNTTAPVVNGSGTITLAATTNTIVRENFTQNIGATVINTHVTFSGSSAQIVNNDIEPSAGDVTGNIVINGNVSGNNKTIQILGNGSDNANVVWSGNQSGLVSSTVIIGESTTSAATRQGRLIMTSQNAIPDPSTTFVLERGSLQFNSTGTLSSSNNIIVRDNAPIPSGSLAIQGPQFHGAYSYIEAQTGGSTLNLHGNITVENSAVTANSNGWKHKLQFVDSFGTNESVIHLQGTNNFNGIESSIITGELRFANQAAVGNTTAQQMSQLTIGQNIVSNSTGGSTPGLNYGNDTGVIVNGGATMGAHLHIAQNQATTGGTNVGNRYIGTTDTTGTVTFSGSITFGVSVVDTSNSSTVAPNGNTTLDVRAPGTSTVVLSGTIGERTGFSGTSTLLINPALSASGSHPHAGYTAPNNTPSGLSGTVRLDQAANSNAAAPDRIWIDGGTLLKTQNNQIGDSTAMVLNGGTFATGGFHEGTASTHGMGALTLSANSTLDMGNGASFVHWNGYTNFAGNSNTLTINNYTGVPHQGDINTDRIYFSGTPGGFSPGEYYDTRFVFTGFASGYKIIQHSATRWEVVPIPEPSTYAAIVLLILAVAYRERKRLRIAWAKISK